MTMIDAIFGADFYGPNIERMTRILEGDVCFIVNPNIRSLFVPMDRRKQSTAIDASDNFSSCEIICLGIPSGFFEDELFHLFKLNDCEDRVLYEVTMLMDPQTDRNRGIARVQYSKRDDAVRAQKELNNMEIQQKKLEVYLTVPDRLSVRIQSTASDLNVVVDLEKILTKLKLDDELEKIDSDDEGILLTFKSEDSAAVLMKESMNLRISWNKSIPSAVNADGIHICQNSTSTSYCICITEMLEEILDVKRKVEITKKTKSKELVEKAKTHHDCLYAHHSLLIEEAMPKDANTKNIIMASEYAEFALGHLNELDESYFKTIHKMIDQNGSGEFREGDVFVGLYGIPLYGAAPDCLQRKVQDLLKMLKKWINEVDYRKAILWAMTFHLEFLAVHPFSDRNGRVSRAIFSGMLAKNNFPKIIIPISQSTRYFEALRVGQKSGNYTMMYRFLCQCILASLKTYQKILLDQQQGSLLL